MFTKTILSIFLFGTLFTYAQVGIGTTTPDAGSVLDITSTDKGILIPRVALTSRDNLAPVTGSATTGLMVFNTNTVGTTEPNAVSPGFYYWDNNALLWMRVATGGEVTKDWSVTGNGDNSPTDFLGTTNASNLVFKTNNTERMVINNAISPITGTAGDISVGNATSGTLKANTELVLRQDGDVFGSSTLRLRNRNGENGAVFETIDASAYLVDFLFKTGASASPIVSNIRFETRAGSKKIATNTTEFQFGKPDNLNGGPTLVIGANGTGSTSSFRIGRLGIGTVTPKPESILDIYSDDKGILIPRIVLTSRDNILPITGPATTGLLVFNTNTVGTTGLNAVSPGFYYWDASSLLWMRIATENQVNQSVKYSNTNTTTSVNPATAINLPVVSTMEWNDNTTLYIANTTSNSITVTQAGRYNIILNISLVSSVQRAAPEIRIAVNGTSLGSYGSTGYMRNTSNHNTSSLHLNETLNLAANDVITVQIVQSALNGVVLLRSVGTTNLMINKVK